MINQFPIFYPCTSLWHLGTLGHGVRGIATGTVFRRLVAKVLARQFSDEVEAACALQFALSTRAGIRVATELNPRI